MEGINLALQTFIGYLQLNGPVVFIILFSMIVLYAIVPFLKLKMIDKQALALTGYGGIGLWAFFILLLPTFTLSSLTQVEYITDWLMLFFMSFGYALIGTILLYPVVRLAQFYQPTQFVKRLKQSD